MYSQHPYEEIIKLRELDKSLDKDRQGGKADQELHEIEITLLKSKSNNTDSAPPSLKYPTDSIYSRSNGYLNSLDADQVI